MEQDANVKNDPDYNKLNWLPNGGNTDTLNGQEIRPLATTTCRAAHSTKKLV